MRTALNFLGIFTATVLFLSIEVKDQTLFSHIYSVISPATQSAQNAAEGLLNRSIGQTQNYSKKLFDNSAPKMKDSVKSKMSAAKKSQADPQEEITINERHELDSLIKSHKNKK